MTDLYQADMERLQAVDLSDLEPLRERLRAQQAYVDKIDSELNAISSRLGSYRERIDPADPFRDERTPFGYSPGAIGK